MIIDPMRCFLTDENISVHKKYLKTLENKCSIIEKSFSDIKGLSMTEIFYRKLPKDAKSELIILKKGILSHKLYFSSFTNENSNLEFPKNSNMSVAELKYELYKSAIDSDSGFLFVGIRGKNPEIYTEKSKFALFASEIPLLAVDLCEHSYFLDYRFDRDKYLTGAINHLDFSILVKRLKQKDT